MVVGGLCWAMVTKHITCYVWRVVAARRMGKRW